MLQDSKAFSGFSVNNIAAAKEFYSNTLGIDIKEDAMGLTLNIIGGSKIFIYAKDDHVPATFTVLNFPVNNIDTAIETLESKGVKFEQYDLGNGVKTDEKGVLRGRSANMGPDIAWFKDPSGNILSILQEK
jgi:hypothetical protein